MAISSATGSLSSATANLQTQLSKLQVQLATGKKAQNYVEQGSNRNLSLAINSSIADAAAYRNTQDLADTRLSLIQHSLTRLNTMTSDGLRSAQAASHTLEPAARAATFADSRQKLNEMTALLNERGVDQEYLFAGRISDKEPVASSDHILFGDGVRAGLDTVVAERRSADVGAGLGRLNLSNAGSSVTLAEDGSHPFGIKISGVVTTGTGVTASVSGTPSSASINFSAVPSTGSTITVSTTLPDGSKRDITFTAAAVSSGRSFATGSTATEAATNLEASVRGELTKFVGTELRAASGFAAANSFFNIDNAGSIPQRVSGSSPATATTLRAATSTDTVMWYTGDRSSDTAGAMVARLDQGQVVSYGVAANEPSFRHAMAAFAVGALEATTPPTAANATRSQTAVGTRMHSALGFSNIDRTPQSLVYNTAQHQAVIAGARERQDARDGLMLQLQSRAEAVDVSEVGSMLLRLQTLLQASYATSASVNKASLINYL